MASKSILSTRTVGALRHSRAALPIVRVERSERLGLSFAQQRLWFLAQMEGVSEAYHSPISLRLIGGLDRTALRQALDRIVARHEALRTTFRMVDGEAVQRIASVEDSRFHLIEYDLRQQGDAQAELDRLIAEEAGTSFDLEQGPLIRGRLIQQGEQEHVLLITMHHIVSDGWSMGVLLNELSTLYGVFLRGEADPLPKLEVQYADYAVWQRKWIEGDVLREQAEYWEETLAGVPELLELPADHVRPAQQEYAGAFSKVVLDEELTAGLKQLGRRHGTTLYMTLLTGWAALLARLSGQQDVVIGTPAANRRRTEIEGLIGFFVNTLAMRLDVTGSPTVRELLARVKKQALAAQQHQDIPFEQVVENVGPVRSLAHNPLFQVMFAWQNAREGKLALPGLEVKPLESSAYQMSKFDLTLYLREVGGVIAGGLEYATSLFEPATIERYLGYFRRLLEAMVADDTQVVDRLRMLSEEERHRLLYEWNDTRVEYPSEKCVHELFEEQVERTPDAVAVVFEEQQLSYAELNSRANQLGHYLRELGVKPDARVGICVERSLEMIIGLLGILKAGGAYVPLDPGYPVERLQFMLEDSAPAVLLTQGQLKGLFSGLREGLPIIDLAAQVPQWQDQPQSNPDRASTGLNSKHLAYVIYTSGSTGTPKGVMIEHRGVCNLVVAQTRGLAVEPGSRILQFASFSFDACVWETMMALCRGASLHLLVGGAVLLREALIRAIVRNAITHITLPPAVLAALPEQVGFDSVRTLIVAGDILSNALARRWVRGRHLINAYGPTEATVCATLHECHAEESGDPRIGRPIANTRIYILDSSGEPVPVGVAGEIHIGGAGVARGYLNREELTAERFVRDPFVSGAEARMYKTGDLGRWLADGNIEFLGRNDFQVKIRGFRIELGEIEARLAEHAGVREAVVVAREDEPGEKRLVAYYTCTGRSEQGAEEVRAEELRSHLASKLPEYMVPAAFVLLESLPLTPNGKLDRKALPAPEMDAYAVREYEAPMGETEAVLAGIWSELLKVERVGRHDNFFELGGHSLLAVRVISRIRKDLDVEVAISDLFAHPRLSDFAHNLEGTAEVALPPIVRVERSERLGLSFAQQRLWFLAQMEGVSEAYHIPISLRLIGGLDRTALRQALDRIAARHEALRTTFRMVDGEAVQRIASVEDSRFHLIEYDLRQQGDAQAELDRLIAEEAGTSFDLEQGPLIRGRLIQQGEQEHVLLITMHHIVSDGWSMGVLLNELSTLYGVFLRGEADPLPKLEVQYADYAVWQRKWIEGDVLREQAEYWEETLAGVPELLELPADHVRPAQQEYAGAFSKVVLDEELTAGLKQLGRRHGTTLYMTLLTGWAALLARLSGQQDVVIGTPAANRRRTEIEGLIGFFVNTLAMRLDVTGSPTVRELLARVKKQALAAQQHQDIPFEQVVENVGPVRSLAHNPLFQVMFAWQNMPKGMLVLPGLEVKPLESSAYQMSKFDLTLYLREVGGVIAGGLEYATSLFEPATIERYLGYFRRLLEAMVADDTQVVDRLRMLSEEERHRLLYEWNDTRVEYPSEKCVHELFEEQVERTPDAVAVVFEEQQLSYAELNSRANQLAHYLRELGVKPDARVGICVERSLEMIIGLLGILKAGGAYVPLDPGYPVERLQFMLEDSAPAVLLTQGQLKGLFSGLREGLPIIDLAAQVPQWQDQPQSNPNRASTGLNSKHLAYVIYTSGSTGTPKGVMVCHRSVVNFLSSMAETPGLGPSDVLAAVTPLSFDIAGLEIYLPLLRGARLALVPRSVTLDGRSFRERLERIEASTMQATPAIWRLLLEGGWRPEGLKVLCGGETLPADLSKALTAGTSEMWNLYGPTETTIWSMAKRLVAGEMITIGRPIANTRIYILDSSGEPVPVGVAGEIHIGGAGVARGYLNREELTAERFVRDPFVSGAEARMYKTGDLGRWLADGNIEFLGRNDFQVKIRGFRIELGEIEARLAEHAGVREAVVVAREDEPGEKRLVAYYTCTGRSEQGAEEVRAEELRSHLASKLPEYMVPAAFVLLESLPLTPNGKLDRKALPAPEMDAYAVREYEAPMGETEAVLAGIWSELLKVERVGRHDNFFELGGHSLLAVRVISRIRKDLDVEVAISDLFAHPRLSDFAHNLEGTAEVALPPIVRVERSERLGLSFAQQRLWFLAQMEGVSEAYHIPISLRLIGGLDRTALRQALDRIAARHEALRTTFRMVDGEAVQRIASVEDSRFHLIEYDLRQQGDAQAELDRLIAEEAGTSFDLEQGPLIRGRLIQQGEQEHVLLITMHHIVSDGWSMGVLLNELSTLYGVFLRGEADPLPKLEVQYADYAVWQRKWIEGDVLREQAEYWEETLAGVPELLELPADHVRPAQQEYAGAFSKVVLDEELTAGLKQLGRRHGTTLYMTLLTGWAALLARLSGQQDVVIGTPAANRRRTEIEGLIGFFVNTLAMRLDVTGSPTVRELLARVKKQALAAQQHQDIPFEQVVENVGPVRSLAHNPLFQVMFAWQNMPKGMLVLPGLEVKPLESSAYQMSKFDLTLYLREVGGVIAGGLEYATSLFEPATIERYLGYFRRLLEAMVADDTQVVDRLRMLSEEERHRLLYEWNDTRVEYPSEKCVHELFEEQVERTPDAVAVVFEEQQLSYAELNSRANQLGHYLRELGVKPDARVGICVERSLEMIIGLLGILKAGGAYVPLDPGYPVERLQFMLEDSAPAVLLTQGQLKGLFSGLREGLPIIDLAAQVPQWQDQPQSNPDRASTGLNSKHLAYVIYTSGSTGTPKGVMIEHVHVARLFAATDAWFHFDESDVWTLFHSYAFDFSVWEIWGALLYGGRLVIVTKDITRSPGDFYTLVCRTHVTILSQTPSAFRQLIAAQANSKESHQMRRVIFGGETLETATLRPWYKQNEGGKTELVNMYGITETTVHVTYRLLEEADASRPGGSPIGRRIPDLRIYILDSSGEPVPVGVAGEIHIGGAGVARGYLNREELTAERFVRDPFVSGAEARMYKTGDLGRWLADGNIEFLGRNDFQVKIRGFRIELGEIEARLAEHAGVREAVVVAREDEPGEKRLVAYYTCTGRSEQGAEEVRAEELRSHLASKLPEYMVPAAFVLLESLPLTPNGKLDRKALPAPEMDAYAVREYEAPMGETEAVLAGIWSELLKVERVGRHDNFFELGGHSLLAVTLIERMRRSGLRVEVRALFTAPTLAGLAATVVGDAALVEVPSNRIPVECEAITPEMLPLVELSQEEIDAIVCGVPGGARNVQDIYPLAPFQEGILFHHLMGGEGDVYLNSKLDSFSTRSRLDDYLTSLQAVIDRHDILRTAVVWGGLREPVQVVWRKAVLRVEEVTLDPAGGDVAEQLWTRFDPRHNRLDIRQAPMLHMFIVHDSIHERWLLQWWYYHLLEDHTTLEVMQEEIQAHLLGHADQLPAPQPFRNLVAQARLGVSKEEHERFFRGMLGDVEESTAPFGLLDVQGDGTGIEEWHVLLDSDLARRIRERARRLGVSAASVCHLAWAQVLAKVSGREDVVFGTVLFGRMQGGAGADRVMGPFINTLPVRIQINGKGAEESVRQTHILLADLLRHEHASLAQAQRCSGVPAPAPLFSALLNYRHSAVRARTEEAVRAMEGMRWLRVEERTNYPFTLSVEDLGEGFGLTVQTLASISPKRVCEFMRTALESLVTALESSPASAVRSLDVLPASERHRLLYEWNDTRVEYPSEKCVHELFEEQVERTPDAVAVVFEEQQLSYAELNSRANQLGHYLRELGVKPDARVGICVERSLEMIIGLLGILKAGGAYVPLDPGYPVERLQFMLEDSAPAVLLTQGQLKGLFSGLREGLPIIDLAAQVPQWQDQPQSNPDRASTGLNSKHLAYVIYTSGSTGTPKGVMNGHRGVINRLIWMQRAYGLDTHDAVLQKTPFSFDVSVWEFFWPLLTGARLVMARPEGHKDPAYLVGAVQRNKITTLHFVPSMLQVFLEQANVAECSILERVVCSGEALPTLLAQRFQERLPSVTLHNLYGPTEAAVDVTAWTFPPNVSQASIPIGRPIANTRIYILDSSGEPVPVGVAGEIHIGGAGVARGYLNREELTAERFVRDPFVSGAEARMYKTGDLGRWLADGNIEFLGRNDFQVKIRGFRIELGEIEARLAEHAGVREAVVVAREDEPGEKRLVAYYTCTGRSEQGAEEVRAEELRSHLASKLPEYMVPAAFVLLESLPLTPNGKLDRKALPAPEMDAYAVREYEAPMGETEAVLAGIWSELLKVERVGRHDNFFELGGHSLLAVRVISRIRKDLDVEVAISDLFAHPRLSDFAHNLEGTAEAALPPIVRVERSERLGLSFAQQRLWFLAQMEGVSEAYHIPISLRLIGGLDRTALRQALDRIAARHEALRTTFRMVDGEAVQRIASVEDSRFHLIEYDLRQQGDAQAELDRLIAEEAGTSFDLEQGPLIRGRLIQQGEQEHVLLITMHHIVSDGWSMGVLLNELSTLYGVFLRGEADPLPKLEVQYADYAVWQRKWIEGDVLREQAEYWEETLAGVPELLELPADHVRPAQQEYAGAFSKVVLDEELTAGLKQLGRRHGTTLYMTLLTGWAALLARLSGQQDVVIGTPAANRRRTEIEGLIGFFVNTLAMRLDVTGSPTVRELLARVKKQALAAQQHQDIPFEQVVENVGPVRSLAHNPLFQVMFAWQNMPKGMLVLPGLEVKPLESSAYQMSKFDLTLYLREVGGVIAGGLEYATSLFEPATIERYLGYFRRLLEAMVADDTQVVDRLRMLSEEERHRLLYEWNDTRVEYPSEKCVHELFEEQVERTPDAVAVVFEEQQLSYAELNSRANQLGHYLRELGVKPDARVGICVERSLEMIIGLLGILKAGGAYVPLDPGYPVERLQFMLEDSAPAVLLTQGQLKGLFSGLREGLPIIDLAAQVPQWQDQPQSNPDRASTGLNSKHLAYVIYTSGSTGTPKGVMIEHRNTVNFICWGELLFAGDVLERALFSTSLSFDLAVFECFVPVVTGGAVRIVRDVLDIVRAPMDVTLINTVPSAMNALVEAEGISPTVRMISLAGEPLKCTLVERIFSTTNVGTVCNLYGPSETTTYSSWVAMRRGDSFAAHIGRPIANTQIYILDSSGEPVPVGVAGEIHIGGAGVARGYLNREELTAERFVRDPFVSGAEARMYKTGDLGRWLADGNIEFLGRNDFQVKIRGFRIELGEIEARLAEHAGVREAVVVAREDEPGERRLVGYVVPNIAELRAAQRQPSRQVVEEWETLWDTTYDTHNPARGPSFIGWNSSYSAQAIPEQEMEEWLDRTIERIQKPRPERLLEIGCGVGLLTQRLAPDSAVYRGMDISASAIGALRQWAKTRQELQHVELRQGAATELADFAPGSFDMVVLNSVAQYFPDVDYLRTVLERAASVLALGGRVFVGDVRHHTLLPVFHSAVQLAKAMSGESVRQLRLRIARAVEQEKELVLEPDFFLALRDHLPRLSGVEIQLKRGRFNNELNRYRYDVMLHLDETTGPVAEESISWNAGESWIDNLAARLREKRVPAVRIDDVPNFRLALDVAAWRLIETSNEHQIVTELREALGRIKAVGGDPEVFWALGEALGYEVRIDWMSGSAEGRFCVVFRDRTQAGTLVTPLRHRPASQSWTSYANDPLATQLKQQLGPHLRQMLREQLPEYMVPATFVLLESLPLTPNGKLDRKALPAPEMDAYAVREYEAPMGETEAVLAGIWSELLKVERVGRHDNFFELGGHSLLAVRVISRIRKDLDVEVAISDLFAHPRLSDFAHNLEGTAEAALPPIVRVERSERLGLSFAQQRLWFLAQMEGVSEAYHIPISLRLIGGLDRTALRQALDRIAARHEALRTTFRMVDGEAVQRIASVEDSRFHLIEYDLRQQGDAQAELDRLIAEEAGTSFDLEQGPLIRGRLIQQGEQEHVLLITMHHIVSDGWSMGVLLNELSTLYGVFLRGEADPLPKLEVQYADYAVWQRKWIEGDVLREQAEYWEETLAGVPELLELPADHVRPAQQEYAGAFSKVVLDEELTAGLKQLGRRHGTTLYMTLLTGWAALLARLSGQQDVVIGTPAANRRRTEIEGLIGFFVNTLAMRLDVTGSPTVRELLARVKKQALAAQQHQDIPFEQVVENVGPVRSLAHNPLFQVMFAWQNMPKGMLVLPGLEVKPLESSAYQMSKFDLTLYLREVGGVIAGGLEYATSLFEPATIERYLGYFRRLLEAMVADDTQVVDRLRMLSEEERHRLLYEWNDTRVEYPSEKCVHELFEEQVERTPDAVAVVFEEQQLSYAELNSRANQLGHYLRELGVKPDARVGICVERSLEMIIGLLGILKAGGAYVPLDPGYPVERLQFMLEDSAPAVLLTQGQLKGLFSGLREGLPIIDLAAQVPQWQDQPQSNPDRASTGLNSKHLAYVIYTSGSTGTPKGVMIEHVHVARLFAATDAWFHFDESDVWTLFHSYAFDFSVWEIWGALLYGGRLVIVTKDITRSPGDFYTLVCRTHVTILSQTPSAFRQLIAAQANSKESHQMRRVIFGGETLETATLRPWYKQNEGGKTELVNMYGITETTVHVTYRLLEEADASRPGGSPIGRRIPDLRIYILDSSGEPVPVGVAGEIHIGGAGVARGYLNREELTAERFVRDPFVSGAEARMYKTGDLGRWLADGNIEFLGRNDFQVKIRGFRIELGEIEARLAEHAGVREAVVVAREDEPGEKRLVAYYTCTGRSEQGAEEVRAEELRSHLASKLPEYMVPAAFVLLESLPLTPNGKLDRKALPAPEMDAYAVREYEAPMGETEAVLAGIWSELLKVERVGRHDNFFELGGHSLLAVRVISRIRKDLDVEVAISDLFAHPRLSLLANRLIDMQLEQLDPEQMMQLLKLMRES